MDKRHSPRPLLSRRMRPGWPHPFTVLRSQRGVALLMALIALSLLYFIALEVSYDSTVDYVVARQQVDRIKARYAAKAGMELSLLRIMIYKQVVAAIGQGADSKLDFIWSFPLMWPPTLALAAAPKANEVDKSMLKEAVDESLMQAQYSASIAPIGGQFDLNDLGSDLKGYQKLVSAQILKIFTSEVEHNEAFARKYSGYRFEELVNNIADYIDEDSESRNGGDESAPYRDVTDSSVKMPPNRPLRTQDELHQVAGMNDEFYDLLASRSTIYGTKGVNINYASKEVLMSLDPSMKEEAVDRAIARRSDPKLGGPFKNDQDFFGFLGGFGVDTRALQEAKFPLLYDVEFNFKVVSTGLSSNVKREIIAVTYDYPNLVQRLVTMINEQKKQDQGQSGQTPQTGQPPATPQTGQPAQPGQGQPTQKIQASKGRPSVVYWEEN